MVEVALFFIVMVACIGWIFWTHFGAEKDQHWKPSSAAHRGEESGRESHQSNQSHGPNVASHRRRGRTKIPRITVEMFVPQDQPYSIEDALKVGQAFFEKIHTDPESLESERWDLWEAMSEHQENLKSTIADANNHLECLEAERSNLKAELEEEKEAGDSARLAQLRQECAKVTKEAQKTRDIIKKRSQQLAETQSNWKAFLCAWLNHRCHGNKSPVATYSPIQ